MPSWRPCVPAWKPSRLACLSARQDHEKLSCLLGVRACLRGSRVDLPVYLPDRTMRSFLAFLASVRACVEAESTCLSICLTACLPACLRYFRDSKKTSQNRQNLSGSEKPFRVLRDWGSGATRATRDERRGADQVCETKGEVRTRSARLKERCGPSLRD